MLVALPRPARAAQTVLFNIVYDKASNRMRHLTESKCVRTCGSMARWRRVEADLQRAYMEISSVRAGIIARERPYMYVLRCSGNYNIIICRGWGSARSVRGWVILPPTGYYSNEPGLSPILILLSLSCSHVRTLAHSSRPHCQNPDLLHSLHDNFSTSETT